MLLAASPGAGVLGNLDRAADDEVRRLEMELGKRREEWRFLALRAF